jgi:hypothetical protein
MGTAVRRVHVRLQSEELMKRTACAVLALVLLVVLVTSWADGDHRRLDIAADAETRSTVVASAGVPVVLTVDGIVGVVRDQIVAGWEHEAAVEAWVADVEAAQARADAEARAHVSPGASRTFVGPSSGSGDCANPVVPESVARRESGCTWDAYNASGCGGRGCLGFYQLDAGHFSSVSPWNSNVSGSCYGLDPSTREGQTECASRLGPSAWN